MKRRVAMVLVAIMTATTLFGCGSNSASSTGQTEIVKTEGESKGYH